MACHFLLQGIFLTQESNLHLWSLALAGGFFATSATWVAKSLPEAISSFHWVQRLRYPRLSACLSPEFQWLVREVCSVYGTVPPPLYEHLQDPACPSPCLPAHQCLQLHSPLGSRHLDSSWFLKCSTLFSKPTLCTSSSLCLKYPPIVPFLASYPLLRPQFKTIFIGKSSLTSPTLV